jgi:hypothetical protein
MGNAAGGSYALGQGEVAQLSPSFVMTAQSTALSVYYPFDEGSGQRANDYNESNGPADWLGTPTWTTSGKIGGGISTSNGNTVRTLAIPTNTTNEMTACVWVNPTSVSSIQTVMAQSNSTVSGAGNWALGITATGAPEARMNIAGTVFTATMGSSIAAGTWSHLCISYAGGELRVYRNGISSTPTTTTGSWTGGVLLMTVGSRGTSTYFTGSLDEAKYYDDLLDADEVLAEYDSTNIGVPAAFHFGDLVAGSPVVKNIALTVQSDSPGYSLAVSQDHNLQSGSNTIPVVTSGDITTPVLWTSGSTKGFGFTVPFLTSAGTNDVKWASGNRYAAIPNSATTFFTREANDGSVDIINTRVQVDVTTNQAAGNYQNTITWTGTMLP